jgi:serine protease inhibitor ecotin
MGKRTVTISFLSEAGSMKNFLGWCAIAVLISAFVAGMSWAGSAMKPMDKAVPYFEKMKSLVGEWEGKSMDGKTAKVSYTLVSDDSALMERLVMGGESEMVTMYHPDGDHLMMTHYCSAHNQPRMRSPVGSLEDKIIVFDLVDVTNLPTPDTGHMKKLVVNFVDKDHFTQEWTWTEMGKEGKEIIQYERKQ